MELRKVGIVGAGPMAASLAQLCAQNGLEVLLVEATEEALGWAEGRILRGLHQVEQPAAFSLVRKATDFRGLGDCDMALETDRRDFEEKKDVVGRIDAYLPLPRVLAVSTAVVPVGLIAAGAENPDRVIGMRFFQPASIVRLVEIAVPEHASENAARAGLELAQRLGKNAVRSKDVPGFVVGRVAGAYHLAALRLLEQGRLSPDAIDRAMREQGFPKGPFEMLDHLGLEEEMRAAAELYELSGRPERCRPSGALEAMLARGCRGRRNGRGFYLYGPEDAPGTVDPLLEEILPGFASRSAAPKEIFRAVLGPAAVEADALAGESVASAGDVDLAMKLAFGWPKGPCQWAREGLL